MAGKMGCTSDLSVHLRYKGGYKAPRFLRVSEGQRERESPAMQSSIRMMRKALPNTRGTFANNHRVSARLHRFYPFAMQSILIIPKNAILLMMFNYVHAWL